MQQLTNHTGISLPLAVWLAADGYDFNPGQSKAISATSLLKPVRQILLREQLPAHDVPPTDISELVASRLGHTIHDGVEMAWRHNYRDSMQKLGYPQAVIDRVVVNPATVEDGMIPIYIEQRASREIMGYKITGKFDLVLEGVVQDYKSTSVFSLKGDKDELYSLQGSIYRWINPEKITADHMVIHFIFTDWQKFKARQDPSYPQQRVHSHRVELLSLAETEAWIRRKLTALEAAAGLPEPEIPFCSDEDLWREDPVWKYYADPAKATTPGARSTKNFDTASEAAAFQQSKGGKGVIIEKPGLVKACGYCPAFPICTQKDLYEHG